MYDGENNQVCHFCTKIIDENDVVYEPVKGYVMSVCGNCYSSGIKFWDED